MPASMMAATPAAAVRARPVTMALLTGFGASSSLTFPGGRARPMSAAISGPRSRNRKHLNQALHSPSYSTSVL